jgi:glucose-6-phosphate isomerase
MITLDQHRSDAFVAAHLKDGLERRVRAAHDALMNGTGAGSQWLGWRRILASPNDALLEELSRQADEIRKRADVLVCIGIGGSYLGSEAVIKALSPYFAPVQPDVEESVIPEASLFDSEQGPSRTPEILFAGHHLSGRYLQQLLDHLDGKSVYVNMISKSGTTLEPGIAFRVIRAWMEERFEDSDRRIIATTDASKGALKGLADEKGYRTHVIADDVGGRFSVLTPVGLLPIAAAGLDIRSLFYGAVAMKSEIEVQDYHESLQYAERRYALHESGYSTEVLSVFEPSLSGVGAWWQQLFGESEGKEHKGLFPATCQFSTDLHSLGQYIQDGRRTLTETFLTLENDQGALQIPDLPGDSEGASADGLAFVAGKSFSDVTEAALQGTMDAHTQGGVPVQHIVLNRLDENALGGLIYFFEHAVAVGGYLLGINPFDQPGVEAYKKAMYARLGRQT